MFEIGSWRTLPCANSVQEGATVTKPRQHNCLLPRDMCFKGQATGPFPGQTLSRKVLASPNQESLVRLDPLYNIVGAGVNWAIFEKCHSECSQIYLCRKISTKFTKCPCIGKCHWGCSQMSLYSQMSLAIGKYSSSNYVP